MDSTVDQSLVQALKNGDATHARRFMDHYWDASVRFATALTGDQNAAEDIAQDALLRAMERIHSFEEERAFRPWYMKIVENLARDYMRSETRRRARQARGTKTLATSENPTERLEAQEQASLLREHLSKLDDDYRLALSLRYIESLSLRDISESMNCPESTVSTRIRRGLERLSRSLSPALSVTPGAVGALLTQLSEGQASQPSILNQDKGLFTWNAVSLAKALTVGLVLIMPFVGLTLSLIPESNSSDTSSLISSETPIPTADEAKQGEDKNENLTLPAERSFKDAAGPSRVGVKGDRVRELGGTSEGRKERERDRPEARVERIVLRAVDDFNRPLNSFSFHFYRVRRKDGEVSESRHLAQVKTDAYGVLEFELEEDEQLFQDGEDVEIQSDVAGFSAFFQASAANAGELDLGTVEIKRTHFGSLTLRLECQGRVLPGGKVSLLRTDDDGRLLSKRSFVEEGVSGEDGRVTLHFGQFSNESLPIRGSILLKGYCYETRELKLKKNHHEIVIELKPANLLKGRVLDGDGQGVKGASVYVEQVNEWTETDELGRFELDHLAADRSYQLRVEPPENSSLLPLTRKIKGDLGEQTWVLRRGTAIEVKAEWPRELTFPSNAQLLLYGKTTEGRVVSKMMSFPKGQVTLPRVSPGRYVLKGYSFSGVSQGLSRDFVVEEGMKSLSLTVRYERCRVVTGRIVDRQGQGIPGLSLNPSLGDRYAHTDEKGRFEFRTAPRGSFEIRVEGSESQLLKLIQVSPGSEPYDLGEFMLERP